MPVMVIVVMVSVIMTVIVMPVQLAIAMPVPIAQIRFTVQERVFTEHQRLDGHRHGEGGHAYTPKVDKVEAP
jgi:hypothetical protein